jgi:phage-related protein
MENKTPAAFQEELSNALKEDSEIRAKVRDLTLDALQNRRLDLAQMKEVVRMVTEGVGLGMEHRGPEMKVALREAAAGMDDALKKATEATHLALQQLTSQAKDFSDQELTQSLETLKNLESEFLSTMGKAAEAVGGKAKDELGEIVSHMRQAGTDTGAEVRSTLESFSNRLAASAHDGKSTAAQTAHELSLRLTALAGGILAGIREGLRGKKD